MTSMADAWRMNPKHFQRPEAPLFSNKEGRPVKKTDLQEALRKASAELGYNPEDYSSHSLRSGVWLKGSFLPRVGPAVTQAGSLGPPGQAAHVLLVGAERIFSFTPGLK